MKIQYFYFKSYLVDGERRVSLYVNNDFKEEVDCNSQFKVKDAKQYLKDKYL